MKSRGAQRVAMQHRIDMAMLGIEDKRFDPNQLRDPHTGEWIDMPGLGDNATTEIPDLNLPGPVVSMTPAWWQSNRGAWLVWWREHHEDRKDDLFRPWGESQRGTNAEHNAHRRAEDLLKQHPFAEVYVRHHPKLPYPQSQSLVGLPEVSYTVAEGAPNGAVASWVEPYRGRWNRWRYQVWVRMDGGWKQLAVGHSRWQPYAEGKLARAKDAAFLYAQRHYGKFA